MKPTLVCGWLRVSNYLQVLHDSPSVGVGIPVTLSKLVKLKCGQRTKALLYLEVGMQNKGYSHNSTERRGD